MFSIFLIPAIMAWTLLIFILGIIGGIFLTTGTTAMDSLGNDSRHYYDDDRQAGAGSGKA